MVLLADGDSAIRAFASTPEESCRPPELRDVDGDGRVEIVRYLPSVLDAASCRMDLPAEQCTAGLPTEWAELWVLADGRFRPGAEGVAGFYRERGFAYTKAALQVASREATWSGVTRDLCAGYPWERFGSMAARAFERARP